MTIQSFATRVLSCGIVAGSLLLVACDADLTGPDESLVTADAQSAQAQDDSHRGARRVKLCHRTGDGGYTKITMAHAALGVHVAHGDAEIGDPVPGMANHTFDDSCIPAEQEAPADIVPSSISAGADHSCGLDASGAAYCWGYNNMGQLGDGTTSSHPEPVAVNMTGVPAFTQIRAGGSHTVALTADGQAYAWGANTYGQLGNQSLAPSATPVAVHMPAGASFTAIDAGTYHSVAVASTGEAYGWGFNVYGMLGTGGNSNSNVPVAAVMPEGVSFTEIGAGEYHTVALASSGAAYGWGANTMGQIGGPASPEGWRSLVPAPATMPTGVTFTTVDAGTNHNVALDEDGAAWAWGGNGNGQLGDGTTTNRFAPVAVNMNGETFRAISAGTSHTAALTTDGEARAWGWNDNGQLGNGSGSGSAMPATVSDPESATLSAISAGGRHTLALTSTGQAYGWGYNFFGQVGDGSTTDQDAPVAVAGSVIFR